MHLRSARCNDKRSLRLLHPTFGYARSRLESYGTFVQKYFFAVWTQNCLVEKICVPEKNRQTAKQFKLNISGFRVFVFQPYPKIKNQCVVGIKFLLILNMSEHLFLETVGLLELFLRKPRFQAKTELLQQFCVLTRHCGSSCCSMEQRHCVTY